MLSLQLVKETVELGRRIAQGCEQVAFLFRMMNLFRVLPNVKEHCPQNHETRNGLARLQQMGKALHAVDYGRQPFVLLENDGDRATWF